mmetsp:Transcript_9980/g.28795  ORF Transcript_9980/g.28795 Transcript_9980/m.28795 type:complete len:538 (-) Transcript_9980:2702-4315(-)
MRGFFDQASGGILPVLKKASLTDVDLPIRELTTLLSAYVNGRVHRASPLNERVCHEVINFLHTRRKSALLDGGASGLHEKEGERDETAAPSDELWTAADICWTMKAVSSGHFSSVEAKELFDELLSAFRARHESFPSTLFFFTLLTVLTAPPLLAPPLAVRAAADVLIARLTHWCNRSGHGVASISFTEISAAASCWKAMMVHPLLNVGQNDAYLCPDDTWGRSTVSIDAPSGLLEGLIAIFMHKIDPRGGLGRTMGDVAGSTAAVDVPVGVLEGCVRSQLTAAACTGVRAEQLMKALALLLHHPRDADGHIYISEPSRLTETMSGLVRLDMWPHVFGGGHSVEVRMVELISKVTEALDRSAMGNEDFQTAALLLYSSSVILASSHSPAAAATGQPLLLLPVATLFSCVARGIEGVEHAPGDDVGSGDGALLCLESQALTAGHCVLPALPGLPLRTLEHVRRVAEWSQNRLGRAERRPSSPPSKFQLDVRDTIARVLGGGGGGRGGGVQQQRVQSEACISVYVVDMCVGAPMEAMGT